MFGLKTSTLNFFHVKCAFAMFRKARLMSNVISNVDEINGFNIITPEEQSLVKDHISHFYQSNYHLQGFHYLQQKSCLLMPIN